MIGLKSKAGDMEPKKKLTKKEKRQRRLKRLYIVAFVLGLIVWKGLQPYKAPIQQEICRNFVELQLRFPETLFISAVEVYEHSWRLYYTYTGSSGEQRSSMIDCRFTTNPNTGFPWIESMEIDRVKIDKKTLHKYNNIIPIVVIAKPENLAVPSLDDKDLVDLKTEWQYHDWQ
jgi:hypothetical protein